MGDAYLDVEGDVALKTFVPPSRRIVWWVLGRWMAIGVVILLVSAGVVWASSGLSIASILVTEIAAAGLLILVVLVFVTPGVRLGRRRKLNEGHFRFVARDDGYFVQGPFGEQLFKWSIYKKAYIDSGYIYLFMNNRIAQIIPLAFVPDPEPLRAHLRKLGLLKPTPKSLFLV
ncbi:MAG TPA: YcxB family protein [Candidatus Dormibacteraeota bacterium]|nr:YcxB family protein [Candidatus Dormibacteraeota bacterium]